MGTGKVVAFTGSGRGKTSAAIGQALMAAARGEQVIVIQFLKGREIPDSDLFRRLEPEIRIFRFEKSDRTFDSMTPEEKEEEVLNLRNGLHFARKVLDTAECDLLVMDEVLGLLEEGIMTAKELEELLENRMDTDVILTGNTMSSSICSCADEISEITTVNFKKF